MTELAGYDASLIPVSTTADPTAPRTDSLRWSSSEVRFGDSEAGEDLFFIAAAVSEDMSDESGGGNEGGPTSVWGILYRP